jgi:outer membrane protein assembly factor BamB
MGREHSRRGVRAAVGVSFGVSLSLVLALGGGGAAAAAQSTDYPMLGHDASRASVSPDTGVGVSTWNGLTLKQKVLLGGFIVSSPAVAYNSTLATNVAYVGASGTSGTSATMAAVNVTTGQVVWQYSVPGNIFSSPAVDGNTVYFGSDDHLVYALNATDGTLECSFDTGGRVEASPVVATIDAIGPLVFVGDTGLSESHNAGHEWALNGVGSQDSACTPRWVFNGWNNTKQGKDGGSWSSPALATDSTGRPLLVFGSNQPDNSVYALDARAGTALWRFQTFSASDSDVGAAPTVSAPGVNGLADGAVYVLGKDRIEYAIDLLTGMQIWSYSFRTVNCSTDPVSGTALTGADVYVGFCKWVYALHAAPTGSQTTSVVWRSATSGKSRATPTISGAAGDQVVIRGDKGGKEDAFRLSDGTLLTSFNTGSTSNEITSSTAVSAGMVYFAGSDGNLYILG